jgi:hypothetical protein
VRKLTGKWLDHYLDWTKEDETHEQYRYWCGIAVLSAVLKNKVYFKRGKITVYPNQYIVLVGPPGCGKGAAIGPAVELGKKTGIPHYLADRMSPEGIIDQLDKGFASVTATSQGGFMPVQERTTTIVSTELSTLLNGSDWIYSFLCDTWDKNEYQYTTKTKGQYLLKNMCVGLLGGCTPDFIRKMNKDGMTAITGGYTSRNIYSFVNGKPKTKAFPNPTDKVLEDLLVEDLKHIGQIRGELKFEPMALANFIGWFDIFYDPSNHNEFDSEVVQNFKARVWSHAVKLAICLSLSQNDSMVITLEHWKEAIGRVTDVLNTLDFTFRSVGESPLVEAQDRILRFIERRGYVSFSEILKYNYKHITAEDLERVLKVLSLTGLIKEDVASNKLMYTHLGVGVGTGKPTKGTP